MYSGRRSTKSNSGFTLVEMVIAVAFLAIISIVLLQLFINAKNLSLKAHDLDQAVQISKSTIETFKACKDPVEFKTVKQFSGSSVLESGSVTTIRLYFDKKWKVMDKSDKELAEKSAFLAIVKIKPAASDEIAAAKNGMVEISVQVDKINPYPLEKDTESEIYRITAEKYFNNAEKYFGSIK